MQHPPSPIPAAPRSAAAEDPHEAASSFDRAAPPRSRNSPESSLLPPPSQQLRAAGAPSEAASSLSQSTSPAQPLPTFNRADYHAQHQFQNPLKMATEKAQIDDAGVCLAALSRCVNSLSRCVAIPLRLQPVCQRGHTSTGTGRPVFVRQGSSPQVAREGRQRSSKLYPKVQIGTEVIMGGVGCRQQEPTLACDGGPVGSGSGGTRVALMMGLGGRRRPGRSRSKLVSSSAGKGSPGGSPLIVSIIVPYLA